MPDRLRDIFDTELLASLAKDLQAAHPALKPKRFVQEALRGLEDLELTGRAKHIALVMHQHLPQPFPKAAAVLTRSLGPVAEADRDQGLSSLRYLPYVFYVQAYGLSHFEQAMRFQYELTKRFTAEWSIRAFLERYPEATYKQLEKWSKDPSVHVRRLVSEGTRPRLPWASRLVAFQKDPKPVLRLLERLKDDPERYVQRSVANNLNDIGKDHPELLVKTCRAWKKGASADRQWIIKHALRSLVKKGHPGALELLGVGAAPKVRIESITIEPKRPKLGGEVRFSLTLVSKAKAAQALMVDYAVHFVKANGRTNPKVFKLKRLSLKAGESARLSAKVSLADLSTRRHYPGRHPLELIVNGVRFPLGAFALRT